MSVSRYYDVKRDEQGNRFLEVYVQGFLLTRFPLLNKSTGYTLEERRELGLEGLLPPYVTPFERQKERVYNLYRQIVQPLDKHSFLRNLQDRNEVLFYALISDHLEDMLPIIYTPTVGEAVRQFSNIYRYPRGFTASTQNIGFLKEAFDNVPLNEVRLIVATDSAAILGIGDQGYGGMAISIGKLAIYTAAGGVAPDKTLPVELDVGTNRQDLLDDPLYLGVRHRRLTGEAYYEFTDRFVAALRARYPKAIIQWEDFAKDTAFTVLERYRKIVPSFNDDIQGTGAVALAGLLSACRLRGEKLADQTVVIHGAGAGGIGVAAAVVEGMQHDGLSREEAHQRVLVLDSRGLLLSSRPMEAYKCPFAQDPQRIASWTYLGEAPGLLETIQQSGATVLLGLSGQPGCFTEPVVRAVQANHSRPVIFPLSNPTSNTEAMPEDVLRWTQGQAIVAAGSPFAPVTLGDRVYPIGQGNNAFVFPGIGFASVLSNASEISEGMVLEAAYALADYTAEHTPQAVYPPVGQMRQVSLEVASRVVAQAIREGLSHEVRLRDLDAAQIRAYVAERMWEPHYLPFRFRRLGL